jgi:hypothetical protein
MRRLVACWLGLINLLLAAPLGASHEATQSALNSTGTLGNVVPEACQRVTRKKLFFPETNFEQWIDIGACIGVCQSTEVRVM